MKNKTTHLFSKWAIPPEIITHIYSFIDIWKYIYDTVVFDIELGIHTSQIIYNTTYTYTYPKILAFKIPNHLHNSIIGYRDIYIPLSSVLQLSHLNNPDICCDINRDLVFEFNKVYNEYNLEKHQYINILDDKLKHNIIDQDQYNRLYKLMLSLYNFKPNQVNQLQYISLTTIYKLPIDKIDNLIQNSSSDPMTVCNICYHRHKLSKNLSNNYSKEIPNILKTPYILCSCN